MSYIDNILDDDEDLVVFIWEIVSEAKRRWNSKADQWNQWHELCLEEKRELCVAVINDRQYAIDDRP